MTRGQKLQDAHLPKASKKRKRKAAVADVDEGGEASIPRAQQIATGIKNRRAADSRARADSDCYIPLPALARFFEESNKAVISAAQTQQVWNQLHKQPALLHYEKQRLRSCCICASASRYSSPTSRGRQVGSSLELKTPGWGALSMAGSG